MIKRLLFTAVLWIVEAAALVGLASVLDGFSIDDWREGFAMVVVISVLNAVLWPLAIRLTLPFAFFTLGLFTLLLNSLMVWLAGRILGGVQVDFWDGVIVAFVLAIVQVTLGAIFNQVDDSYDRRIVRRAARRERAPVETDEPGVLFLEIDGLAEPILREALAAGRMPHLARWLEGGSHRLLRWEPDLSSQTGASQAGILLGNNENVVAFRWWDREHKRLVSCSSLKDVAALEQELSHGNGLLHPDGASRGNLFSGDAGDWMMTSSKTAGWQKRRHAFFGFFSNAYNVPRVLLLMVWEISWRQAGRSAPGPPTRGRASTRTSATRWCVRERTSISSCSRCTRSCATSISACRRCTRRSSPTTRSRIIPASTGLRHTASCGGSDGMFARIERATQDAPRPYRIVILSDHGQSQARRSGSDRASRWESFVERLAGARPTPGRRTRTRTGSMSH